MVAGEEGLKSDKHGRKWLKETGEQGSLWLRADCFAQVRASVLGPISTKRVCCPQKCCGYHCTTGKEGLTQGRLMKDLFGLVFGLWHWLESQKH